MLLKFLILILIPIGCLSLDKGKKHKVNCKAINNEFAHATGEFVQCVMKNNEDASFCLNCVQQYSNSSILYNALIDGIGSSDNITCRSRFVDNNQLNLVETLHQNTQRFWDIGFCSGENQ